MYRRRSLSSAEVLVLLAPAVACVLLACDSAAQAPAPFVLALHARSPDGAAVPGARFWADGRALGTTAENGSLRTELGLPEGTTLGLTAACPPAYRTETPERRITLARGAGGAAAPDAELELRCQPLEQVAALVVLLRGPNTGGLPIRIGGEAAGQTEGDGTAHLLWSAPPRSTLRVELDTEARPELRPQHPVHTFRLGETDSVLLIEQTFAVVRRRSPRREAALGPAAAPRRPERIR